MAPALQLGGRARPETLTLLTPRPLNPTPTPLTSTPLPPYAALQLVGSGCVSWQPVESGPRVLLAALKAAPPVGHPLVASITDANNAVAQEGQLTTVISLRVPKVTYSVNQVRYCHIMGHSQHEPGALLRRV